MTWVNNFPLRNTRTTWPVIGLPPVDAGVHSNHEDNAPANATGVPGVPGTDGIVAVPVPGGSVVEPGRVVVEPVPDGTVPGLAYASLLGERVPGLVTTLLVAVSTMAAITLAGDAAGTADK